MNFVRFLAGLLLAAGAGHAAAYTLDGSPINLGRLTSGSMVTTPVQFAPTGYEFGGALGGADQSLDGPLARRLLFRVNAPGLLSLSNSWNYRFERLDDEVCDGNGCSIVTGPVIDDRGNQLRAFYLGPSGGGPLRYSGQGDAATNFFATFCGRFGPDCYMEDASNSFQPLVLTPGNWVLDWTGGGTGSIGGQPAQISLAFTATGPDVPEPATWALLLAGFGVAGTGLRLNRRRAAAAARSAG